MTPARTEAKKLVSEMWNRVDGGGCTSCTSEAIDALKAVWPDVPWDDLYDEMRDEED